MNIHFIDSSNSFNLENRFFIAEPWEHHDGHTDYENAQDIYAMSLRLMSHLRKCGQKQHFLGGRHGKCQNRGYGSGLGSSNRCSGPSYIYGHTRHDHIRFMWLQFPGDHSTAEEARELMDQFRCVMLS